MNVARRVSRWTAALAALLVACSCSTQCSGSAHRPGPNIVANGGFESPVIAKPWTLIANGMASLAGWAVSGNGVEIITSAYWQPRSGKQSVNLSSNGAASAITQQLKTSNGSTYTISWYISANPQCTTPRTRGMDVVWDQRVVATPRFDVSGHSFASMGWTLETTTVRASGAASTLTFERSAATDGSCGIAIDDVSVHS